MDNYEFAEQLKLYWSLEQRKNRGNLNPEQRQSLENTYAALKNYVLTGEEIIELGIGKTPEEFEKYKEEGEIFKQKIDEIDRELKGKEGNLIERLKQILLED